MKILHLNNKEYHIGLFKNTVLITVQVPMKDGNAQVITGAITVSSGTLDFKTLNNLAMLAACQQLGEENVAMNAAIPILNLIVRKYWSPYYLCIINEQ